ncbi:chalcone isomerase family protein [Hyalangium rubrum]|uniref:Chalcone isomerase family protein n=1 Tax=Hyalangium rubrum TaxID=3103134 RepID=A0ABU5H8X3_9BACT|nr:chalcone isomerase family protein [Hyalangium sp. s54d21]MDY7229751.1 chalcone isomerase family protein [Hyalangium sp. s54d21]
MKVTLSALVLSLTLALPALAKEKEVAGVKFPETISVEGKELKLNGAGLRTKAIFKVYTAGLYVETTSKDSQQLISSDQVKRVRMTMLRDLEKSKITDAISDGIEKNNKAQMAALKQRLDTFNAAIPDLKKGDELLLTYVPGQGTTVESKAGQKISVEGKDFADALFGVWLGKNPVDGDLKDGMLGKED